MKFIENQIFYEYVLDVSDDKPKKFNIDLKYDMSFMMCRKNISFLDANISINIITDYDILLDHVHLKNLLI